MDVPLWVWASTIAGILALLIFDFFAHVRTPQEPSLREAADWSMFNAGPAWLADRTK